MARILPYESQVGAQGDMPGRQAQASDFGGAGLTNLGQATESLGQNVGQVQRFMLAQKSRQEVTDASVQLTKEGAELTESFDSQARAWKPGDVPLSESFTAKVKARLDQLRGPIGDQDRFTTQAGVATFETHAAQLSQHFVSLARQADAKLAGEAAVTQQRELVDTVGNFLRQHPAYFQLRQEEIARTLTDPNGIYGRIPVVEQQRLVRSASEQLAVDAVQGLIRKTPNHALEILRDPMLKQDEQYGWIAQYVPGEKMNHLLNMAESEVRAVEIEARQHAADQKRQLEEMQHQTDQQRTAQYFLHQENPGNPNFPALTATDIAHDMQDGKMSGPVGRAILGMMEADANRGPRATRTNPAVEMSLFKRIHLPDGDPRKIVDTTPIYNAYTDGQLSDSSRNDLRRELVESRSPDGSKFNQEKADFLRAIEPQITKPGPFGMLSDPTTPEKFLEFKRDLDTQIAQYRKDGKDPRTLFMPKDPQYFWAPENRIKYTATSYGSLQSPSSSALTPLPNATPRKSLEEIFGVKP